MKGRTIEDIKEVLQEQDKPLGVNEIARLVGKPVATIHKYLKGQRYLIQDENKKWRLPDTFDDLWAEKRLKELKEGFEDLCNKLKFENAFEDISAGKIERTDILEAMVSYDIFLYEIKRMTDFIKREATIRLDGRK